jgi:DNA modification methylase
MKHPSTPQNAPKAKSATLTVERLPLAKLKPHPRNPRKHPGPGSSEWETLQKSIEHDYFDPIVWNKRNGLLVSGHLRTKVLTAGGYSDADCVIVDYDEPTHLARMIAANKATGENNENLLKEIFIDLDQQDVDLDLTGFTSGELEALEIFPAENNTDDDHAADLIDKAAELQKQWKTARGQLWELGEHRIMCGDSTSKEDVGRLIGDDKPHLMVTDPPYGVEYDANWRNEADRANGKPYGARAVGKVQNDDKADWTPAWQLFPGDVAYVWHAGVRASEVSASLECAKFGIRSQIIWAKNNFAIGRGDYHWQHGPCWYAVRVGAKGHYCGDRSQTTLWQIDKPQKSETGHSTQKPLECMARPIRNNSKAGDLVYEPFSGSGTTLIACEQLQRKCRAMEIDPGYVAVALQRWADLTGKTPKLING